MTREEAIEVLKELWRYEKSYKYTDSQIRDAINMAIKALEERLKMDKELLKKDLKGRQKKIEKLIAENYVLQNRLDIAMDNYDTERMKNLRLYSKYIVVLKELAQYKKNERSNYVSDYS